MTNLHETDRLVERLRKRAPWLASYADEKLLNDAADALTAMGGKAEPDVWKLWTGEEGSGFTFETERVHAEQFAKEGGRITALYASPVQARTGEVTEPLGQYDDVLSPFLAMMEAELHANSGKGDRPGWLAMSREELLLEIYYHLAKMQKATLKEDHDGIREFGADVANMAMMLVDRCGALSSNESNKQ